VSWLTSHSIRAEDRIAFGPDGVQIHNVVDTEEHDSLFHPDRYGEVTFVNDE
jgi:hypothetical protein